MTHGALRVLDRHLTVFRRNWLMNMIFNFVDPLLYLTALGFGLGAYVTEMEGMSYSSFIAPGMVAASAMWAATFECTYGTFIRLNYQKTFHAMLAAPMTVKDIVLGEILFAVVKSILFGLVILSVVSLLGLIHSWWAVVLPLFVALPGFVFACMAMSYTAATGNIDNINYYITLFITPVYLFSGVFFPAGTLPYWSQVANQLNPLYHSVELCRMLAMGPPSIDGVWHIGVLLVMGGAALWFPLRRMERNLIQ